MAFSGRRLADIRAFKGWRVAELARRTGLNRAEISRLENEITKDPRVSTVEALAEQLDVTGEYLQGYGPEMDVGRAAVLQALERFKKRDAEIYHQLDDSALEQAASYEHAYHTVAHWRAFVEMSVRAWAPRLRARKTPKPKRDNVLPYLGKKTT